MAEYWSLQYNALSGIPGNSYVLNSQREFMEISEILAEIMGNL